MKASDVARGELDRAVDAMGVDPSAADELFAVVDVLQGHPTLQRALSDPSASPEARQALAQRLFGGQVGPGALSVISAVVQEHLPKSSLLPDMLERQGIRALLTSAANANRIQQVQHELHSFGRVVAGNPQLSDALRNRALPLENRRAVVSRLTQDKVHPVTAQLLERANAGRSRNLPRTIDSYLELAASMAHQQVARVTVAKPLSQEHEQRLQRALESQVGGPVSLQIDVDPRVLGGIDIHLGTEVIESTVAGRIADARRLLKTSPAKVGRNG